MNEGQPDNFDVLREAPILMTWPERVALYALVFGMRPERLLEIGTNMGGSAMVIAAAMTDAGIGRMICVDPAPVVASEHRARIAPRGEMLVGGSPEARPEAARMAGGNFDFALIDGDHSHDGVVRDIEGVLPVMTDTAFLLFHDVHYQPVQTAIDEMLARHASLSDCGLVSRYAKPDEQHPGISWGGIRMLRFDRHRTALAPVAPHNEQSQPRGFLSRLRQRIAG